MYFQPESYLILLLYRFSTFLTSWPSVLCSFFKWFTDTDQKDSSVGVHDEVTVSVSSKCFCGGQDPVVDLPP